MRIHFLSNLNIKSKDEWPCIPWSLGDQKNIYLAVSYKLTTYDVFLKLLASQIKLEVQIQLAMCITTYINFPIIETNMRESIWVNDELPEVADNFMLIWIS